MFDAHLTDRAFPLALAKAGNSIPAKIGQTVYLGTDTQILVHLDGGTTLNARMQNTLDGDDRLAEGAEIHIAVAPGAARFLVE